MQFYEDVVFAFYRQWQNFVHFLHNDNTSSIKKK